MTPQLSPYTAFIALAIGSLVVTVALAYLAMQDDRLAGFRTLSGSYGVSTLRFGAVLASPLLGAAAVPAAEVLHALSAALMAIAAARIAGLPERRAATLAAAALAGGAFVYADAAALGRLAAQIPVALYTGSAQLYLGWALFRLARRSEFGGFHIVGAIVLGHGVQKLGVPFWPQSPVWQFWGLVLGGALFIATAVGLLVAAQRAQYLSTRAAIRDTQASSERFEALFRLSPNPTFVTTLAEGRYLAANEAWFRASGYGREELIGRTGVELGLYLSGADREAYLARLARDGAVRSQETRYRNRAGETRFALISTERLDWRGEPALISSLQDVTDLERARGEAQASSERFEALFRRSPNPSSVTTLAEGRYLALNEAWARAMGYAPDEMLGRSSIELGIWPEARDRARFAAALRERGRLQQHPVRFRTRTGEIRGMLIGSELIDWRGEPAILASMNDVTELEHARSAAQASSERFAKLFELSPVPTAVSARAGGQLLAVNAAWSESTGYARDEALGRSSLELGLWVDGSERPAFVERVRRGEAVRQIATRHRRRNGEIVEVLLSGAPIEWDGVPAMLVIPYDVTALKRVEEEIRRLNASLEDKVRERTAEIESFSYTVSHDLRAPLRHLSGFAGLLRERPAVQSDPEAMKYAERLGASAKRLGHMVDSLLEYSRLGRNPLVPRDVDLAAEAQLIIGELGAQARERQVRWKIGPLPVVRGDSTLLRSVLQNLLDNALKYTRTRGEALVELGARAESAQWIVFVRDNGVGFDMRYAGKLFGVFQRLHGEREFEGTGIGLAHAARIVQRHGGRMWCEAAPEQGACFFFSLPR